MKNYSEITVKYLKKKEENLIHHCWHNNITIIN